MQSIRELESIVVGMVMDEDRHLADAVARGVTRSHFADPMHGQIFEACVDVWKKGQQVDLATLCLSVGRQNLDVLTRLRRAAPPTDNFAPYAQALLDNWRQLELHSRLAAFSHRLGSRRLMDPLDPIVDELGGLLMFAKGSGQAMRTTTIVEALDRSLAAVEERVTAQKDGQPPGVTTGFPILDRAIYGFQPGFMYVLGARTSVGKTTLATVMAVNAARSGRKTAFVTVEMSDSDIADKMLSRVSKVNIGNYLSGTMEEREIDRISSGASELAKLPLLFTEVEQPKLELLEFEVMRLVKVEGVELVIVDYLQLFETSDDRHRNPREVAKHVSASMKRLARTMKVPILVLSQLNRQAPEEGEPELIHIAESDQIARDADVVLFLYRAAGAFFLSIGKQRRGAKKVIRLKDELHFSLFEQGGEVTSGRRL